MESAQRDDEVSGGYTHGHHESVLRAHRWRPAQNSAGYLIPRLKPGMSILDVGCGPGTITDRDLAELIAKPGRVVGMDAAPDVISQASALDSRAEFVVGDAYALPYADREFDVVHAHQVLQHLARPVDALRRVAAGRRPRRGRRGGLRGDRDPPALEWSSRMGRSLPAGAPVVGRRA